MAIVEKQVSGGYPDFGALDEPVQEGEPMLCDPRSHAFPCPALGGVAQEGLSIRELFSAMALQGIMANPAADIELSRVGEHALAAADSLIRALNRPVSPPPLPAVAEADLG